MYSKKCQLIDFQKITREGRKPHCTPQWGGVGMLFRCTHESLANGVKSTGNGLFAYIYSCIPIHIPARYFTQFIHFQRFIHFVFSNLLVYSV